MHGPVLSIIIVSYNTAGDTYNCLRSIIEQSPGLDYEVIVVDNNSTDGTCAMLCAEFPQVRLIENAANVGFARANNQGLAIAKGKYTLYLNPDTIILDAAILKMVEHIRRHPEIGVLGPHTYNADGQSTQNTAMNAPTLSAVFHAQLPFWKLVPGYNPPTLREFAPRQSRYVDGVKGCCMLVSTALARDIGGLNEEYFMYAEEYDFCEAARERGKRNYYMREAHIIHLGGTSTAAYADAMAAERLYSVKKYFRRKHPASRLHSLRWYFMLGSLWRSALWLGIGALRLRPAELVRSRLSDHRAMLRWLRRDFYRDERHNKPA